MTRNARFALCAAFLITGIIFFYRVTDPTPLKTLHESSMGTYAYSCDGGIRLHITFSDDTQELLLSALDAIASTSTLTRTSATSGVRYVGEGVVLEAAGETMRITRGSSVITCIPVQIPDQAPFNFGD